MCVDLAWSLLVYQILYVLHTYATDFTIKLEEIYIYLAKVTNGKTSDRLS